MSGKERKIIVTILAAAALLRVFRIGRQSLWVDEILTLSVSDPKSGLTIWEYLKFNMHGPLHSFVVYLFNLINSSDGWLRLPSAAAGVAGVYYFFKWISLWIDRKTAMVGCLLLAVSPVHIYYSQELRNYSFLIMFAMIACCYFHEYLLSGKKRSLAGYCMAVALAALSNFTAAFLFAAHTLIYFMHKKIHKDTLLRWLLVSICILLLISPWVYRIYMVIDFSRLITPIMPGELSDTERLRGPTTITLSAVPYGFYALSSGFSLGPSLRFLHQRPDVMDVLRAYGFWISLVALSFGTVFVIGFWRFVKQRKHWMELSIYILTPVMLTLLLCWQNAKAFNVRYMLLALPPYLCVLARAQAAAGQRAARFLMTAALISLSLVSAGNYYFNSEYSRENIKDAVRYMEQSDRANACIIAPKVGEVVEHYLAGRNPVHSLPSTAGTAADKIAEKLQGIMEQCADAWYVKARARGDGFDNLVMSILVERYRIKREKEFAGVTLFYLDERDHR